MIEMKRTVNALSAELGRATPCAGVLPTDRRGCLDEALAPGPGYALALAVPALAALLRAWPARRSRAAPLLVLFVPGLFAVAWLGGIGPAALHRPDHRAGRGPARPRLDAGRRAPAASSAWGLVLLATSSVRPACSRGDTAGPAA